MTKPTKTIKEMFRVDDEVVLVGANFGELEARMLAQRHLKSSLGVVLVAQTVTGRFKCSNNMTDKERPSEQQAMINKINDQIKEARAAGDHDRATMLKGELFIHLYSVGKRAFLQRKP